MLGITITSPANGGSMPSAEEVTHRDWTNTYVLYDDGRYSAIWGDFRSEGRRLGVRWNVTSTSAVGFPNARGYPVWHVEPQFLEGPILQGLLRRLLVLVPSPHNERYIANVTRALRELPEAASGHRQA